MRSIFFVAVLCFTSEALAQDKIPTLVPTKAEIFGLDARPILLANRRRGRRRFAARAGVSAPVAFANTESWNHDGVDDLVLCGPIDAAFSGGSALTVVFWMRLTTAFDNASHEWIISSRDIGNIMFELIRPFDTDAITFRFGNTGAVYGFVDSGDLFQPEPNNWIHVAAVYNGSGGDNDARVNIYFDGIYMGPEAFSGTIPATLVADTPDVAIGALYTGGNPYGGDIDEVAIYAAVASQANITEMFAAGKSAYDHANGTLAASLKHLWRGDDDTHPNILDRAGTNHCTMIDMAADDITTNVLDEQTHFVSTEGNGSSGAAETAVDATNYDFSATDQISFATWLRGNGAVSRDVIAVYESASGSGQSTARLEIDNSNGDILFNVCDDADGCANNCSTFKTADGVWPTDATWHLVVATVDTTDGTETSDRIYVDGSLVPSTWTTAIADSISGACANPLVAMLKGSHISSSWTGKMASACVWSGIVSPANVTALFGAGGPAVVDCGHGGDWPTLVHANRAYTGIEPWGTPRFDPIMADYSPVGNDMIQINMSHQAMAWETAQDGNP